MKLKKPLTDKELGAWENSRDMGAELLESVRQMVAKKGRIVMSPVISARKNRACRKSSLPSCWAYRYGHYRSGNKVDASLAAQPRPSSPSPSVDPKFSGKLLPSQEFTLTISNRRSGLSAQLTLTQMSPMTAKCQNQTLVIFPKNRQSNALGVCYSPICVVLFFTRFTILS